MEENTTPIEPKLKCIYGNVIKIQNLRTMVTRSYLLVPPTKERFDQKHISNYTEIGQAVWAKEENDVVEIEISGKGKDKYKIISVESG